MNSVRCNIKTTANEQVDDTMSAVKITYYRDWTRTMEKENKITLSSEAAVALQDLMSQEDMAGHSLRIYIAGAG